MEDFFFFFRQMAVKDRGYGEPCAVCVIHTHLCLSPLGSLNAPLCAGLDSQKYSVQLDYHFQRPMYYLAGDEAASDGD